MTTPKLPEPAVYCGKHNFNELIDPNCETYLAVVGVEADETDDVGLYTADQVREILEIAAKESDNLAPDPDQWSPKEEYTERRTARACAAAIRVLKEQL